MAEHFGWLLDVYADPQEGLVLWLLEEDGARRRLHQPFPVTFYAAGAGSAPAPVVAFPEGAAPGALPFTR